MKRRHLVFFVLQMIVIHGFGQTISTDSTPATLNEVTVKAYEHNRYIKDIGAAVNVVGEVQLNRFSSTSLVAVVNTVPGVRMEERSPGSYRLNIRGSSLRSPFGVRNVKVYYDGIPFTDPGGNTYLNQLSFYNISSIEILKGPGSSLYGAGTGGVMLAEGFTGSEKNGEGVEYSLGSYNTHNLSARVVFGSDSWRNQLAVTWQKSDGYRQQSAMDRKTISWETSQNSGRLHFDTHVLLGDLNYETPGGLTLAQYLANPKAARPAGGGFPSAVQARAKIFQKTVWIGLRQQYDINAHWQQSIAVYGAYTNFKNPGIRSYEKRSEPNAGGRASITYTGGSERIAVKWTSGVEAQQGYSNVRVFKNKTGQPDSLLTDDEVNTSSLAAFSQVELDFSKAWTLTLGTSLNRSNTMIRRASVVPNFVFSSDYKTNWSPRVSLLRKLLPNWSVYGVVSKGFSPPSTAELIPSTTIINTSLQAEKGWNYELGSRATFFGNRLSIDVNAFMFRLQQAIVQRKDASGADYFVNAGATKQSGIETSVSFVALQHRSGFIQGITTWASHAYHHFRYDNFKQVNTDFSGKQLPGDPAQAIAGGADFNFRGGFTGSVHYYFNDPVMMNDANTDRTPAYHLIGAKVSYMLRLKHGIALSVFAGGENLTNTLYSNGNDINAAAGRYYNAAAGVNYYAGLSFQHHP